jgi:hypothetical protein
MAGPTGARVNPFWLVAHPENSRLIAMSINRCNFFMTSKFAHFLQDGKF